MSRMARIQGRDHLNSMEKEKEVLDMIKKGGMFARLEGSVALGRKEYELPLTRAVYDCFLAEADFYRPYFDMNGEPYPWHVSEKGVTFYNVGEESLD
jgi:hypothetical protein